MLATVIVNDGSSWAFYNAGYGCSMTGDRCNDMTVVVTPLRVRDPGDNDLRAREGKAGRRSVKRCTITRTQGT